MERKQTRYSISVGNSSHIHVGNYEDLSLNIITLLYKHAEWQDFEHVARQLGLNGGKLELAPYHVQSLLVEYVESGESKDGDINIIAALGNSLSSMFRLHVFELHEERAILQDAYDDLQLDIVSERGDIERLEKLLKTRRDKLETYLRLSNRLQEKINEAKE